MLSSATMLSTPPVAEDPQVAMSRTSSLLIRSSLRMLGLPSIGVPGAGDDGVVASLQRRALLGDVLFHGSGRDDLDVLEPIRRSRDKTEFGDQEAVYATTDPVWAMYFALLRRGRPLSTRNASIGIAAGQLYPRWYFFSLRGGYLDEPFENGWVYLLPREDFTPEPPLAGKLDTAQWVSSSAVRPVGRIAVKPSDFPFRDLLVKHREREPMLVTSLRAGMRTRIGPKRRPGPPDPQG
jgi:hypothetical protein